MMLADPMHAAAAGKPRLLITGAGGYLGYALCQMARRNWSVTALFRTRKPAVSDIHCVQADLTDLDNLSDLLRHLDPQAVIHAAAVARAGECQSQPGATEPINEIVPARLAAHCAENRIDLLFTSTDLVFDGRHAPYDESAPPKPACIYGAQKARAEAAVLARWPRALVCRLPLLFGMTPAHHGADYFAWQMVAAIAQGRPLNLFVDEYRTPVDIFSAAQGMLTLLGRARGLLHLGGRTRLSRYALGLAMARQMNVTPTMIRPVALHEIPVSYRRAPDCALDSQRAYALGYDPLPLEVAVGRMVEAYARSVRC